MNIVLDSLTLITSISASYWISFRWLDLKLLFPLKQTAELVISIRNEKKESEDEAKKGTFWENPKKHSQP